MELLGAFLSGWFSGTAIEMDAVWLARLLAVVLGVAVWVASAVAGIAVYGLLQKTDESMGGFNVIVSVLGGFAVLLMFGTIVGQLDGYSFEYQADTHDKRSTPFRSSVAIVAPLFRCAWLMLSAAAVGSVFRSRGRAIAFFCGYILCYTGCICVETLMGQQAQVASFLVWIVGVLGCVSVLTRESVNVEEDGKLKYLVLIVAFILFLSVAGAVQPPRSWLGAGNEPLVIKWACQAISWLVYGPLAAVFYWIVVLGSAVVTEESSRSHA